jgi:hypothetical protein
VSRPHLLAAKCDTCIFRPGNPMHLRPGRVAELVQQNIAAGAALTCHKTLPYGEHPEMGKAVCRGFYDAVGHRTNYIRVIERLGGFAEIQPPRTEAGTD